MKPLHIDKNIRILSGDAAKKALAEKNDLQFVSEDRGVVTVPRERWVEAQHAEQLHWMKHGINSIADRNEIHLQNFNNYKVLEGMRFKNAIELGCGPFTNLRIIGLHCDIEHCTLLDPLIEKYLTHPNCSYTRQELMLARYLSRETLFNRILGRFFTGSFNTLRKRINPALPVQRIIASAIETMPTDGRYDLLCIINVLEHCYDVDTVFRNILAIIPPGGVLVFQDQYYDYTKVPEMLSTVYDAAHPLRVDRQVIESFLANNFETLYKKETSEVICIEQADTESSMDEIYFVGRKLNEPARFSAAIPPGLGAL
jgi:SAM-dependent methyltransferase